MLEEPRIKATGNFVSVVINKAVADMTRDDMLNFRDRWQKRLDRAGLTPNSAHKDIGYVESTLRLVNERKRLRLDLPFGKLTLKEDEEKTRPPFLEKWIMETRLIPGALSETHGSHRLSPRAK